jgi:hypothetical protein
MLVIFYFPPATALVDRLDETLPGLIAVVLVYFPMVLLLTLPIPLFSVYGKKPTDVEH